MSLTEVDLWLKQPLPSLKIYSLRRGNSYIGSMTPFELVYIESQSSYSSFTGNCSVGDIQISQSQLPGRGGLPTFIVEVRNICPTRCDIAEIHLNCAGFSHENVIDPKILMHSKNSNICIINNNQPLKFRAAVLFEYSTNFMYKFSVASVECV